MIKRVSGFFSLPAVTFLGSHILFNRSVVEQLGAPSFVYYYINMKTRVLGIEICESNAPDAVEFSPSKDFAARGVKLSNRFFVKDIERLMGWDLRTNCYRAFGRFDDSRFLMSFNLNKAKENSVARLWLPLENRLSA